MAPSRTLTDTYFLVFYTIIVIVAIYLYRKCFYSVKYGTFIVLTRGGRITRFLTEGYHWVWPWERVETVELRIGKEIYFRGQRVKYAMEITSPIRIIVRGLDYEYKVFIMLGISDAHTFLTCGGSPLDIVYTFLLSEFTRTFQLTPFIWGDVNKIVEKIRYDTNNTLKGYGITIVELRIVDYIENEKVVEEVRKNELAKAVDALELGAIKRHRDMEIYRCDCEKAIIDKHVELESHRRAKLVLAAGVPAAGPDEKK